MSASPEEPLAALPPAVLHVDHDKLDQERPATKPLIGFDVRGRKIILDPGLFALEPGFVEPIENLIKLGLSESGPFPSWKCLRGTTPVFKAPETAGLFSKGNFEDEIDTKNPKFFKICRAPQKTAPSGGEASSPRFHAQSCFQLFSEASADPIH